MKLPEMTFKDIHWTDLPVTTIAGEVGQAQAQVAEEGEFAFAAGSGLAVSDYGDQPHRIRSEKGCRVFIVD